MDKPKCRVCGAKHWNSEPHVFKNSGADADEHRGATADRSSRAAAPPPDQPQDESDGPLSQVERNRRWRERNRERYNEYMREYRRKKK